ncbi:hypothetical protein [Massilia sp. erpn]|uniref:hypothetical protein n=1 Tax=Massilia sp. erpn TaxID=2738142 RepID=UPI00210482B8|nr:hypothetical protein [Massilia sp. erpn]UTY58828.1 hypothetical protein HPQ68_17510 [Massilia sp. erpn]
MTLRSTLNMRVGALLFFFFALFAMRFSHAEENSALPVSIYQLMANPEKYDGKEVYVIGFMHLEFEGDVLYAHREDWVHTLIQNGLALDVPKSEYAKWLKINNNYVVVQALFSATERGHFALRAGSLTKISKLAKWQVPKR